MTLDDLQTIFDAEHPYHPEWSVSSFGLVLSPMLMVLLELYLKHPQARRSTMHPHTRCDAARKPEWRPPPRPSRAPGWLDQKQLASGEKPDDD